MNYSKLEIQAVLITGLLKFILVDFLSAKFWFIILAGTLWVSYILWRIHNNHSLVSDWGLSLKGFKQSLNLLLIPAIGTTIISIWYGLNQDVLIFNWHIIPILILYPLWGTIQQLLIISLFGGNIYYQENVKISKLTIVGLTSILFSVVHYPSLPLMIATFFLAIFYCMVFFKFRNILALGLFHGLLASIFYFFVLGRDPWIEFIGSV